MNAPLHLTVAVLVTIGAMSAGDLDGAFGEGTVIVSGNQSDYYSGPRGEASPGSTGDRAAGIDPDEPVLLCDRLDTMIMSDGEYQACSHTSDTGRVSTLINPVEPIIDDNGNPVEATPVIVTVNDLQEMPILAGEVRIQLPSPRVLINAKVLAHSTAQQHILEATVMATQVQVRVTPVDWQWEFVDDDRGVFHTDYAGAPYPDMTVYGIYSRVGAGRVVSSTITWMGEYRIGAGPWLLINGNATTTATSDPFETVEAPTRLVADTMRD